MSQSVQVFGRKVRRKWAIEVGLCCLTGHVHLYDFNGGRAFDAVVFKVKPVVTN